MPIDLMRFKAVHTILKNELKGDRISLKYALRYECKPKPDKDANEMLGQLGILIHADEGFEKPEDSSLFISVDLEAHFNVSESLGNEVLKKETLRLFFPFAQTYITQLTANAQMTPLYVPNYREDTHANDVVDESHRDKKSKRKEQ